MKLNFYLRFLLGFFSLSAFFNMNAFSKEEVPLESARPSLSVSQTRESPREPAKEGGQSENIKEVKEPAKEGGKEQTASDTPKQLPPCKGSYSKVKWTDCRGVKREYNGPHFVGQSYDGEFRSGRPHGQGDMKYHDGSRFVGSFEMGVRDGPGVEYAKDGSLVREGFWRAGVLVRTFKIGPGAGEGGREEK